MPSEPAPATRFATDEPVQIVTTQRSQRDPGICRQEQRGLWPKSGFCLSLQHRDDGGYHRNLKPLLSNFLRDSGSSPVLFPGRVQKPLSRAVT